MVKFWIGAIVAKPTAQHSRSHWIMRIQGDNG